MKFSLNYIKIGFFSLGFIYFLPLDSFAGDLLPSDSLYLGSSHLVKLVIPQPASSNRFEYDYIFLFMNLIQNVSLLIRNFLLINNLFSGTQIQMVLLIHLVRVQGLVLDPYSMQAIHSME